MLALVLGLAAVGALVLLYHVYMSTHTPPPDDTPQPWRGWHDS